MEMNLHVQFCPQGNSPRPHRQAGQATLQKSKGKRTITETSHFKIQNKVLLVCVPDKLSITQDMCI